MKLLDAIHDARLFAHPFGDESWQAWRTFFAALFAETPCDSDLERYREATGRRHWPMQPFDEAWRVIGRRGGKSQIAALVAVYVAAKIPRTGIPRTVGGERISPGGLRT